MRKNLILNISTNHMKQLIKAKSSKVNWKNIEDVLQNEIAKTKEELNKTNDESIMSLVIKVNTEAVKEADFNKENDLKDVEDKVAMLQKSLTELSTDNKNLENAINNFKVEDSNSANLYTPTFRGIGDKLNTDRTNVSDNISPLSISLKSFVAKVVKLTDLEKKEDWKPLLEKIKNGAGTLIAQPLTTAVNSIQSPINDLKAPDFKTTFRELQVQYLTYEESKRQTSEKQKERNTRLEDYKKAEVSTENSFIASVQNIIEKYNKTFPMETRSDTQELKNRAKSEIVANLNKFSKGDEELNEECSVILTDSFTAIKVTLNPINTRNKLVAQFVSLFKGYAALVQSDDPILTAILKSGKVKFYDEELAVTGSTEIPKKFKEIWELKKGSVDAKNNQ